MSRFFSPNIDGRGRWVRGIGALALLTGAGFAFTVSIAAGSILLAAGLFVAVEALRGWCLLRACGLKTRL
jgi:hypothetical protein